MDELTVWRFGYLFFTVIFMVIIITWGIGDARANWQTLTAIYGNEVFGLLIFLFIVMMVSCVFWPILMIFVLLRIVYQDINGE